MSFHVMQLNKPDVSGYIIQQHFGSCYLCVWLFILAMDLHREKERNCNQADPYTCTCRSVVNAQAESCNG